jgi:cytochrome c-type biogenesis protein
MDISTLTTVIWLALIDSFDPCIFAIYTSLLISVSVVNMRKTFATGLAFIASAFIGYSLFGIFLRYITLSLPRYILALITTIYGFVMLFHTLIKRRNASYNNICREDEITCKIGRILKFDVFIDKGIAFICLVGFIAAFTLFPCTAGMYIVFNLLTIELSFIEWLPLALFYVTVFISPLILILISFMGITRIRGVYNAMLTHQDLLKILGSALLIAISIYIFITSPSHTF